MHESTGRTQSYNMFPRPCAVFLNLIVCGLLLDSTASFLLEPSLSRGSSSQSRAHTATGYLVATKPSFPLFAKKARKGSDADKKSTPATGGFGSASPAAVSAASSQGKSRGISGRSVGAGSKPLRQAATMWDSLRKEQGAAACHDVYVRSPDDSRTTFWFVGKIARNVATESEHYIPTPTEAVLSQKRIILEYAKQHLRPQNFGGKYAASLELWLAPADSEMDVVQNKVTLERVKGSVVDLSDDFSVTKVGFNPEIYVGDELNKGGLRVERDEEGRPNKPQFEVNQSA